MLDRIIKKDWGLMLPVEGYDSSGVWSESPLRFIAKPDDGDDLKRTSIHKHSCASSITVVSGRILVRFSSFTLSLQCGERVDIPADSWHMLEFPEASTLIVEDYDYVGDTYPIERHEGEDWPSE